MRPPRPIRGQFYPHPDILFPRGMYMRPPRPIRGQFHPTPELEEKEPEEEMNMSKSDSGAGGPKSLMSIKITNYVKATGQTQILDKAPKLMTPLGPSFHKRPSGQLPAPEGVPEVAGPRPRHPGSRGMPPSAPSPGGLLPTPAIHDRIKKCPRGGGRDMEKRPEKKKIYEECFICCAKFISMHSLDNHLTLQHAKTTSFDELLSQHIKEKTIKCSICCTEFISRNNFRLHVASKHGNRPNKEKSPKKKKISKCFNCCAKGAISSHSLDNHLTLQHAKTTEERHNKKKKRPRKKKISVF